MLNMANDHRLQILYLFYLHAMSYKHFYNF